MKHFLMAVPGSRKATLEGYLADTHLTLGQLEKRPGVIVIPGGGYVYCSRAEGEPIALRYLAKGFHSFVLRYSTGHDAAGFRPLQEIDWAIGYIRENADAWGLDPERLLVCGFSAGGHLALASGLLAQNKPNAMILGYPAASAPHEPSMNFMLKLLTGKEAVTGEDARPFDLVPRITKDAPPVFLMATAQDLLTNYGALPIAQKYAQLGLPYEVHIFGHGPHGYALADETSCNGSSRYLNDSFAQWHELSVAWFYRVFGKLEFADKDNSQMAKYLAKLGISLNPGV